MSGFLRNAINSAVIPAKAREVFDLKCGDKLLLMGDEAQGIAMVKLNIIK